MRREEKIRKESTCYVMLLAAYGCYVCCLTQQNTFDPPHPTIRSINFSLNRDARDDDGLNPMKDQLHLTLSLRLHDVKHNNGGLKPKTLDRFFTCKTMQNEYWKLFMCHNLLERFGRSSKSSDASRV